MTAVPSMAVALALVLTGELLLLAESASIKEHNKEKRSSGEENSANGNKYTEYLKPEKYQNMVPNVGQMLPGGTASNFPIPGSQQGANAKRSVDQSTQEHNKEKRSSGEENSANGSKYTEYLKPEKYQNMVPNVGQMLSGGTASNFPIPGSQQGANAKRSVDQSTQEHNKEKRSSGEENSANGSKYTEYLKPEKYQNMVPNVGQMLSGGTASNFPIPGSQQGANAKRSVDQSTQEHDKEKRSSGEENSANGNMYTEYLKPEKYQNMVPNVGQMLPGGTAANFPIPGSQQGANAKRSVDQSTQEHDKEKRSSGEENSANGNMYTEYLKPEKYQNMVPNVGQMLPGGTAANFPIPGSQQGANAKRSVDQSTQEHNKEKRSSGEENSANGSKYTEYLKPEKYQNMVPNVGQMLSGGTASNFPIPGSQQGANAKRSVDKSTQEHNKEKRSSGEENSANGSKYTEYLKPEKYQNMVPNVGQMLSGGTASNFPIPGSQQGANAKRSVDQSTQEHNKEKRSSGEENSANGSKYTEYLKPEKYQNMVPNVGQMLSGGTASNFPIPGSQQGANAKRSVDQSTQEHNKEKRSSGEENSANANKYTEYLKPEKYQNMVPNVGQMLSGGTASNFPIPGSQQGANAKRSVDQSTQEHDKEKRSPGEEQQDNYNNMMPNVGQYS